MSGFSRTSEAQADSHKGGMHAPYRLPLIDAPGVPDRGTGAGRALAGHLGTQQGAVVITRGAAPQRETVVNVPEPGGFKSTLTAVGGRGTSVEIQHFNFDGAFHQTEGSDPRELSFKRVDARTIEQQTRRNGQITVTRRIQLSPDGKTMTYVASGVSGGGQRYTDDTRVYEKQE